MQRGQTEEGTPIINPIIGETVPDDVTSILWRLFPLVSIG